MEIKAEGRLRHHFFGNYSAVIGLKFDKKEYASLGLQKLIGIDDRWKPGERNDVLIWFGSSDELKKCKEVLGSFGADVKKIDSIKYSIDFGEKFECTFQVDDPGQLKML